MKQASDALKNLLLNSQVFFMADLFTITLTDGVVLRYTNCDVPLTVDGNKYSVMVIERNGTKQMRGINVDELDMTIDTDKNDVIPGGLTFLQGIAAGTFDNAILRIDRVFSPAPFIFNMPSISRDYVLLWWVGIFNVDEAGGTTVEVKASSMTQLLNVKFPRNLYYPPCIYTLGDSQCGVNLANYQIHGQVVSGSTRSVIRTNLSLGDGYLNQGSITFTSGANTNVTRTIRAQAGGQITTILPFQTVPQPGDLVTVCPGCTKAMDVCRNRFNNLANFRAYPFIPVPETAY